MYRDQFNGQVKRFRGMLIRGYGRIAGDQVALYHGTAMMTEGSVQVTCARALAHVASTMRGISTRRAPI